MKKGFTLIELLIVIAVLAVLSAGIFVAIDPIDKINLANDSKVQNDIGQIAQAMEAYAVANNGSYPANASALTTSGDLKIIPAPPTNYSAYGYVGAANTVGQTVYGVLKAKKYSAASYWVWCSTKGKAMTSAGTTCP